MLGIRGPTGAIRGYEVVESSVLLQITGAFQAVAVPKSRCRLRAGETWQCTVVTPGIDALSNETYRVARLTVSAHTAAMTTSAHPRWRQSYP